MVSDEQIRAALRQARVGWLEGHPPPYLRVGPDGTVEIVHRQAEPDTHDLWRELNGDG